MYHGFTSVYPGGINKPVCSPGGSKPLCTLVVDQPVCSLWGIVCNFWRHVGHHVAHLHPILRLRGWGARGCRNRSLALAKEQARRRSVRFARCGLPRACRLGMRDRASLDGDSPAPPPQRRSRRHCRISLCLFFGGFRRRLILEIEKKISSSLFS